MYSNPGRFSKKALAMTLATILILTMVPFFASAGTLLDAVGVITDIGPNDFLVNVSGSEQAFFIDRNTFLSANNIQRGDRVQVVFLAEQPDTAVEVNRIGSAGPQKRPPRQDHTHYSVTGVITNAGMSSITVLANGKYRTFGKDDAVVIASDGILLGDTVEITYEKANPEEALQIEMVSEGENHNRPVSEPTHYAVTGVVTNAGMSTITVLAKGKYRTFGKEDASLVGMSNGILLGDTVKIIYVKSDPQNAIQIKMVKHGGNH